MIKDDFCDFCNNIKLDNFEDMQTTVKGITKKLNKHYYDIDDDESNMYIVGSVGRTTKIQVIWTYFLIYLRVFMIE